MACETRVSCTVAHPFLFGRVPASPFKASPFDLGFGKSDEHDGRFDFV
jgi:hypothetical protein